MALSITPEIADKIGDPIWRLNNFYHINAKGQGKIPFKPFSYQQALLEEIFVKGRLNHIIIKVRRKGFSTLIGLICLDQALFTRDMRISIVDQTAADAEKKLDEIIRFAWIHAKWKDEIGLQIGTNDGAGQMSWTNGSRIYAGKNPRGGTNDILWCSEWGPIQHQDPVRSKKIKTGGLPSADDGLRIVETTWMGGKYGDLWELTRDAMEIPPEQKTPKDFWFHFAPWYDDPRNRLMGDISVIPEKVATYLERAEERLSMKFDDQQKIWYWQTDRTQGDDMGQEYPTFPEEAFTKAVPNAIFAKWIARARTESRMMAFKPERTIPIMTFWDIGMADLMAVFFIQVVGREIRLLKCYQNHHEEFSHYAQIIRQYERDTGAMFSAHYLPHDGNVKHLGADTRTKQLEDQKIGKVVRVKRNPKIWDSIDNVRDRMDMMWYNTEELELSPRIGDKDFPSALDCLEGFHSRPVESERNITNEPVHDITSHVVSALRTFGDAWTQGLIEGLPSLDGREPVTATSRRRLPTKAITSSRTSGGRSRRRNR